MKPQVSQHSGEYCQVTGSGMTEPGLQGRLTLVHVAISDQQCGDMQALARRMNMDEFVSLRLIRLECGCEGR